MQLQKFVWGWRLIFSILIWFKWRTAKSCHVPFNHFQWFSGLLLMCKKKNWQAFWSHDSRSTLKSWHYTFCMLFTIPMRYVATVQGSDQHNSPPIAMNVAKAAIWKIKDIMLSINSMQQDHTHIPGTHKPRPLQQTSPAQSWAKNWRGTWLSCTPPGRF